jgi:glutamate--cysteine ligase
MQVDQVSTPFISNQWMCQLALHQAQIEKWFEEQWQHAIPPFYNSVDLRNAGFKMVPVDLNLFPAGFNNLDASVYFHAAKGARATLEKVAPGKNKILIVPESHTRNKFYFLNIEALTKILVEAGYEVKLGSLREDLNEPQTVTLENGYSITLEKLTRTQDILSISDYEADIIILNNDLSDGCPAIFKGITQPIFPSPLLGWFQRLKTTYFGHYQDVCETFSRAFGFDCWLIDPLFRHCGEINFMTREGEACLLHNATLLFEKIKAKYSEYGISDDPFVIVKANAGTYGMGVMAVKSPLELTNLNRKQRTKMAASKGGQLVGEVILQEGVPTIEKRGTQNFSAESVIYSFGQQVAGGFYRVHEARGMQESLNAPGMRFESMMLDELIFNPAQDKEMNAEKYVASVVVRLSSLAAAREKAEVKK